MSAPSRFHQGITSLTLQGAGESREEALNRILVQMRQRIGKQTPGAILYMAPVSVEVTREREQRTTERFLGALWPRSRARFELEVRIDVEVRWLQFQAGLVEEETESSREAAPRPPIALSSARGLEGGGCST